MNELIKVTPNDKGEQIVSARDLYAFLEVKSDFTNWCKRMFEYGFEENKDYSLAKIGERSAHNKIDYALTIDTAKEISMLQRSEKGKQARQYFIECEKNLRHISAVLSPKELAQMVIDAENAKEAAEMLLLTEKSNNNRLEAENELANKTIQLQAPKVQYVDKVLSGESAHNITTIAKELGMTAIALNNLLYNAKVQFKQDGHWVLYAIYQGRGYTKTKTHAFLDANSNLKTTISTAWTEKGRKFIHDMIGGFLNSQPVLTN